MREQLKKIRSNLTGNLRELFRRSLQKPWLSLTIYRKARLLQAARVPE